MPSGELRLQIPKGDPPRPLPPRWAPEGAGCVTAQNVTRDVSLKSRANLPGPGHGQDDLGSIIAFPR